MSWVSGNPSGNCSGGNALGVVASGCVCCPDGAHSLCNHPSRGRRGKPLGDTIKVAPGTYTEQVSIGKDISITGASAGATQVRAPAVLAQGALGKKPSIIEIHSGATARISKLAVSGPGASPCGAGSLWAGIKVVQDSTLDLSHARVTDIHDTPFADCDHNGTAILVGDFIDGESGDATITDVTISNYQTGGVVVFGESSDVTVTRSTVTGNPQNLGWVYALEWGDGATLKATYNVLLGNKCDNLDIPCGSDPETEGQAAGIGNGPGDPGTDWSSHTTRSWTTTWAFTCSQPTAVALYMTISLSTTAILDSLFRKAATRCHARSLPVGKWALPRSLRSSRTRLRR